MIRSFLLSLSVALFIAGPAQGQDDKALALGRTTYQLCVACHGPDGKGMKAGPLVMAPALQESAFVKGNHLGLLTAIILKGIHKEDTKYVQAMLPLEAALNDEQIAALIAHVTKEYGGQQRTVKPGEVAKWRKEYAARTSPWKRSDLEGMIQTANAPKLLSNVRYSLYIGEWKKLPDFATLTPAASGKLDQGLIALEPAKGQKKGFGLAFDADLTIPESGEYVFSLISDDGSALVIDGETVIGNDGIHPAQAKEGKEKLQAGHHTLRVLYFDGGGQRSLALSVKGPGKMGTQWLSKDRAGGGGGGQSYEPIPLTARQPGEAIVHRAFLPDAKPRAIGVGYPGAVNLVWDADVLNLAYIYRGDFMDAASHWNGRGSGSKPLGQDRVKPAHGLPFQILESLDEPWQPFSEAKVKYERDTTDPQKEITFNVRHPDYQFRGYRLDAKRFPTFQYDYRKLKVTDTFAPEMIDGVNSLVRTLKIEGDADENTYLRIAETGPQTLADGWIDVGGNLKIQLKGAEPEIRKVGDKTETLARIGGGGTLTITYSWSTPLQP
jgi:cytochrome c553